MQNKVLVNILKSLYNKNMHLMNKRMAFVRRSENMKNFILMIIIAVMLVGCGEGTPENEVYRKISAEDAKKMMDENEDIIILDVRTEEEYQQGHIQNSLLIPDTEIQNKAEELLADKDAVIIIYCRSGRRSENATKELIELGYTKTFDFGGINDWPYETVQ